LKFVIGHAPEWAGKPKASPLDDDADFQALRQTIISGSIKPGEQAGLYINEFEGGKRLGAKNPARMVRDHLNRLLKENELENAYRVTCRLTADDRVWGVWVKRTL
jgi:hypothetical protein